MTLGALIALLEQFDPSWKVVYDFAYCTPTKLASYRGDYSQLALGWRPYGYAGSDQGSK